MGGGASNCARTPFDEAFGSFAAARVYTWQWDIVTGRVTWGEGVAELFGRERGSLPQTYDAYLDALGREGREVVETAIDRALRGETEQYYVEHRVARPGSPRWLAAQGRVLRDEAGRQSALAGLVWDITARKENEARVNRLWSVARESNQTILRMTSETALFTTACRIAVEMGLFQFACVCTISADESVPVEPLAQWGRDAGYLASLRAEFGPDNPVQAAIRQGQPWIAGGFPDDERFMGHAAARGHGHRSWGVFPLRRGGRVLSALSVYGDGPRPFDDEQVELLLGLADDLTYALEVLERDERRRKAEEALRSSEERYRAVFEQAFEGIFLVAPSRAIIDANDSACRMLSYTREALLALRAEGVIHPEDLQAVPFRFAAIPRGGVIVSERRFVRSDGSIMHGELTTKALLDGNFQVVVRDVSERKQVQAQLLLSDRLSSLGRLASGVAHEINNPLAYLTLNLELLGSRLSQVSPTLDPGFAEPMQQAVRTAREGAERVRQIVRTLTTFGRGEEEQVGPVDLNTVMDSAMDVVTIQLRHSARVKRDYAAAPTANANAFRLGQVFVNLLLNAADALPEGCPSNEIHARTQVQEDGRVVAEVRDNGVGIPANVRPRIFDPFFTTKAIGKGMGLGLSVCHTIVTSFGGEITCTSAPGEGTTFRVVLQPSASATTNVVETKNAPSPAEAGGRVLVIDDDPLVGQALATALEGHDVAVVSSGREALARCRAEPPDCMLCDVMMPEVSGLDMYRALGQDGHGLEERIVFITGGAVTAAVREALARISNPVLEKPVSAAALRDVVAATVARSRSG
jgi:PAS domain S-box-containing protein